MVTVLLDPLPVQEQAVKVYTSIRISSMSFVWHSDATFDASLRLAFTKSRVVPSEASSFHPLRTCHDHVAKQRRLFCAADNILECTPGGKQTSLECGNSPQYLTYFPTVSSEDTILITCH